ncbi:MAG TPA: hydrogenase expression/formation protein HypE [Spirochaetota bacterium]|nr:hydrogenase expression/formation protein HypE [Spirochaetota bacterium]HPS86449.1 hydrogenase expression/formation protein HypE [Spirochaetota bacterium]
MNNMKKILPGHGSGGKLMNDMISGMIKEILGKDSIQIDDSAVLDVNSGKIAFTTDSYTVTPIFFPGGDIGKLAVNGTVNDLAVMGAVPKYLSCSLILEEGFDFDSFEKILISMKESAEAAGVKIVTGDTKVVPNGKGDKIYINTSGIGVFEKEVQRRNIQKGDKIIVSGTLGDHGITIMSLRNDLRFSSDLKSDCAPLNGMIRTVTGKYPGSIKFMRDATRGGLASVLNEITAGRDFSAGIIEDSVPVSEEVKGICSLLGLDPLYVANEGKVVIIAAPEDADGIVEVLKQNEYGKKSAIIGEIDSLYPGKVYIETFIGGKRLLPLMIEEQLPRIC